MSRPNKVLGILVCCVLFSACVTKKKRSEPGWLGKIYHNTTAKFNGYYNATVLMDESQIRLEDQHKDNYTQLLDIYPLIAVENPKSVADDLDKAIEKVITVSVLHPYSNWVDDCYLLMAEAQYLKQDFESAEETLEYFSENFNPGISDSRRKQQKKDEKSAADIRREELKAARELRAEDRKREEEFRDSKRDIDAHRRELRDDRNEIESEYRESKRNLEQKHKAEENDFKAEVRELEKDHREELAELKKKHRDSAQERRKAEMEAERKARDELKKEREKAARENTRSERRKKTDETDENKTETQQQPQIDPEVLIEKQEQAEISGLQQKQKLEMDELLAEQTRMEQKWVLELAGLEKELEQKNGLIDREQQNLDTREQNLTQSKEKTDELIQNEREAEILAEEESATNTDKARRDDKVNKGQGGGLFKHKPVYYEGLLLQAKTYVERHNWSSAEYILRKLQETPEISKEVAREIPVVNAQLLVKREKYAEAIPHLEQAIGLANKRDKKARYAYVMAQIHENMNALERAHEAFLLAENYSTEYEMEFNARLSMARHSRFAHEGSVEKSLDALEKLMKDGKNQDYLDQIYFARAEIKLATGDEEGAFEDFKNALSASRDNKAQKTESYYRLANIYYDLEDFGKSQAYFDSTSSIMSQRDGRYPEVRRLANNLRSIARNIETIKLQDSLLTLSRMSDEELYAWAEGQLEEQREKEDEAAEQLETANNLNPISSSALTASRDNSSFFAYNPLALQKGKLDFSRKWGNRKLEDDWRLASRQSSLIDEGDNTLAEDSSNGETDVDGDIRALIKDVPRSESDIAGVLERKETAMYQLGTLYRSEIQRYDKSISTLESLLQEFEETEHRLDAYYNLYLDNLELDERLEMDKYYDLIVTQYPESEYAQVLSDPNYLAKLEARRNKLDEYYNETYDLFLSGEYSEAETRIAAVGEMFEKNKYASKFDLLLAMIQGSKLGKASYIKELRDFIVKYPNTAEETRAKEILRFLQGDEEAFDSRIYEEAIEEFTPEDEKLHYIIIVVYEADEKSINQAKIQLSKYHNTYHKLDRLKLSNIYLNPESKSQIILVRRFENRDKAMSYVDGARKNPSDFVDGSKISHELFAVTQKNYREIMKQRTVKNYRVFFDNHYAQ